MTPMTLSLLLFGGYSTTTSPLRWSLSILAFWAFLITFLVFSQARCSHNRSDQPFGTLLQLNAFSEVDLVVFAQPLPALTLEAATLSVDQFVLTSHASTAVSASRTTGTAQAFSTCWLLFFFGTDIYLFFPVWLSTSATITSFSLVCASK